MFIQTKSLPDRLSINNKPIPPLLVKKSTARKKLVPYISLTKIFTLSIRLHEKSVPNFLHHELKYAKINIASVMKILAPDNNSNA